MISHYHPRQASQPEPPPPPPERRTRTPQQAKPTALASMYSAGQDAARHGSNVARIWGWQLGDSIRGGIIKLCLAAIAVVALMGVVVTMAVWGTIHVLGALATVLGGGLLGATASLLVVGGLLATVGISGAKCMRRRRTAALRKRLDPDSGGGGAVPEATELEQMQKSALNDLRGDKDRLLSAASGLLREYPVTSLGISAGSGFATGRWLLRSPKTVRRAAVGVLRAGRAAGLASVMNSVADRFGANLGGESSPPTSGTADTDAQSA